MTSWTYIAILLSFASGMSIALILTTTLGMPLFADISVVTNDAGHAPTAARQDKKFAKRDQSQYGDFCDATVIGEKQKWNQHKRVISYAVFAPSSDEELLDWVVDGIHAQAMTAKQFYPDWVLRFYTVGLTEAFEQELIQYDHIELIRCIRYESKSRMMIHRYLVLDDPTVMYSMIRDVDSRFTLRELMAVNEFLSSPHLFHTMRDHDAHTVPVMGGVFDMKRGLLDSFNTTMTALFKEALEKHPEKIPGCCGEDQGFLSQFLWPKVRDVTLDHDSTSGRCSRYKSKECRDYPLGPRNQDNYYFIGAAFKQPETLTSNMTGHVCTLDCKIV